MKAVMPCALKFTSGFVAGEVASRYVVEPVARAIGGLVGNPVDIATGRNPIHRRCQYDPAGELVRTLDKLRGEIKDEYEANGQLRSRDTGSLIGSEEFR